MKLSEQPLTQRSISARLRENIALKVCVLEHLGLILNFEKLALQPVQCLEYLGLIQDTIQAKVFLPARKTIALRDPVQEVRSRRCPSIQLVVDSSEIWKRGGIFFI